LPQLVLGLLALAASASCRTSFESTEPKAVPPIGLAAAPSQAPPAQQTPPRPWAEALRTDAFAEADQAFRALPEDAARSPDVRYAWARTRLELGQAAEALELLEGLEPLLPALQAQIVELRLRARVLAGEHAAAAETLEARGDVHSLSRAARAWLAAGQPDRALRIAERALATLGKRSPGKQLMTGLRLTRGTAAAKLGKNGVASADFRHVLVEAPLSDEARLAAQRLEALGHDVPLLPKDRLKRARALAQAGRVSELEAELAEIEPLGKGVARPGVFASLRGMSLFAARADYRAAEKLFERAAELGTEDAAKEFYYVARCRARALDDAGAEQAYRAVMQKFPTTPWAEQAELAIARLRLAAGDYSSAAAAYAAYLTKRGGRARFGEDASYERAVALLASKQPAAAAPLFKSLLLRAKDERFRARVRQLHGAALLMAGQREPAVRELTEVMRSYPLTFAALAARARLEAAGAEVPRWLEPARAAPAPAPLDLKLPADVALLHRLGLDRDADELLSEHESRLSRSHAPRSNEALCELYGQLEVAGRRYRIGQAAASDAGLDFAPSPRSRWMWDCVYPKPYQELVTRTERELLLPRTLLWSVMRQESAFRVSARSPAGAVGLMQIMPATAEKISAELGEPSEPDRLTRAHVSIRYGAHYLRKLLDTFGGSVPLAVAAYNAGPHAVSRWLAAAKDLPLDVFVALIPYDETQGYVERVLGNLARYAYREGGEDAVAAPELTLPAPIALPPDAY
jgi:soluble lytic murein transglycosylase